jgi:hypothetical protein
MRVPGAVVTNLLLAVIAAAVVAMAVQSYRTPGVTPAELAFLLAQKSNCAGNIAPAQLEP